MFELVLMVCLFGESGEMCRVGVSPKVSQIENCEASGDRLAKKLVFDMRQSGLDGRVEWQCRKRGDLL